MAHRSGYSALQIGLHWLVAVLVFGVYFTSEGMGRVLDERLESGATGIEGNTIHVWLGGAVFALVLIRVVVRLLRGAPGPSDAAPPLVRTASVGGHRIIYLLLVLVPASGAAAWYAGVEAAGDVHEVIGNLLVLLAAGHALMAIAHEVLWRDGTIARMVSPEKG